MRDCENCKHRVMKVEVGKGTSPEHFWGCECWECEFEPTTKNDLGVDLISRAEAIRVASGYCHPSNVAKELAKLPSVTPQPCEDAVSRQAVLELIADYDLSMGQVVRGIHAMPSVTPQEPRCKECKWWKDSDGEYRRGVNAESQCPINRKEVYEGNGYCYLYEPQESED